MVDREILKNYFGDEVILKVDNLVEECRRNDYQESKILDIIKDMSESLRICMYLIALERDVELALKIERINKRLKDVRVTKFKEEYFKDKANNFLGKMNRIDKISLLSDMDLNILEEERDKLRGINKEYYDVLKSSIMNDKMVANN